MAQIKKRFTKILNGTNYNALILYNISYFYDVVLFYCELYASLIIY